MPPTGINDTVTHVAGECLSEMTNLGVEGTDQRVGLDDVFPPQQKDPE